MYIGHFVWLSGRRPKRPRAHSPMPDITIKKSKDSKGERLFYIITYLLFCFILLLPHMTIILTWHFTCLQEIHCTFGSFWSLCCRTRMLVPDTSSGPTGKRAYSSLWTPRRCHSYGANTKTNRTWTTKQWEEHFGRNASLSTDWKTIKKKCKKKLKYWTLLIM